MAVCRIDLRSRFLKNINTLPLPLRASSPQTDHLSIYFFSARGKSGMVLGLAVAGVCFPLVNSLTLSEI